jgi:hypothetical protein
MTFFQKFHSYLAIVVFILLLKSTWIQSTTLCNIKDYSKHLPVIIIIPHKYKTHRYLPGADNYDLKNSLKFLNNIGNHQMPLVITEEDIIQSLYSKKLDACMDNNKECFEKLATLSEEKNFNTQSFETWLLDKINSKKNKTDQGVILIYSGHSSRKSESSKNAGELELALPFAVMDSEYKGSIKNIKILLSSITSKISPELLIMDGCHSAAGNLDVINNSKNTQIIYSALEDQLAIDSNQNGIGGVLLSTLAEATSNTKKSNLLCKFDLDSDGWFSSNELNFYFTNLSMYAANLGIHSQKIPTQQEALIKNDSSIQTLPDDLVYYAENSIQKMGTLGEACLFKSSDRCPRVSIDREKKGKNTCSVEQNRITQFSNKLDSIVNMQKLTTLFAENPEMHTIAESLNKNKKRHDSYRLFTHTQNKKIASIKEWQKKLQIQLESACKNSTCLQNNLDTILKMTSVLELYETTIQKPR